VSSGRASAFTSEPRAISVVVPTWNGGERFLRLLERLAGQQVDGGFQLVVVDSSSSDGSADAARAAGALVEVIDQSEFNHGATRNRGIARSSGERVLLLTQDAIPQSDDYVATLARVFDETPVDAAYARQFPLPDQDPILAERLRNWAATRDAPCDQTLAPGDPRAALAAYLALEPLQRLAACAFDNVASAVRRTTWERHPFPAAPFGEDVAFGKELLLAGGTIRFEPRASVEHSHPIDLVREFKRLYCDHRNLHQLFEVRTVPTWRAVWDGWHWQRRTYFELLDRLPELSASERRHWKRFAVPYSLAEPLAQFLGARSNWKVGASRFWTAVDRRLRRGV
jgi:rhamnosyltransferase